MINRVGRMCVAAMSLCIIVLIVTRKRGDGRFPKYFHIIKKLSLNIGLLSTRTWAFFFYRFVMVVGKNVLEYIIALVVAKNKVRYRPILVSLSAMTLIMYILRSYQLRNLLTLIVENWSKFWY
jgi:hypothetical protein